MKKEILSKTGYYYQLAINMITLAMNHDVDRTGGCESFSYDRNGKEIFLFSRSGYGFDSDVKNILDLAAYIVEDILRQPSMHQNETIIKCEFHKGTYIFTVDIAKKTEYNSFLFSSTAVH